MGLQLSDYLVQVIYEQGVKDIFIFGGGGMMYMLDAIGKNKNVNAHYYQHEQCAGIAAEAYAKTTGKIGYCFTTSGPGSVNIIEAITECWLDSVPVVFIIGQNKIEETTEASGIKELRQHGVFETNILPMVKSITKSTYVVKQGDDFPLLFRQARQRSKSHRPGPVVVIIPLDMQKSDICSGPNQLPGEGTTPYDEKDFINILDIVTNANKPLILAGQGIRISETIENLHSFIQKYNIPVVTTQAGKDIIEYENKYFIGHPGIKGDRAGSKAIQESDVILCIGTSLNILTTGYDTDSFGSNAKILYLDSDPALIEKCKLKNAIKYFTNINAFLYYAVNKYTPSTTKNNDTWISWNIENKNKYKVYNEIRNIEENRLDIYTTLKTVNQYSDKNDIIISDSGCSFYIVGQAWQLKKGQRFISSNGLGTMGWGIPASSGASLTDKRILCFIGDGSFFTGMVALLTLKKENRNIKLFVFINDGYTCI